MDMLRYQTDPAAFQRDIVLPTGQGPRRFADIMADFQAERFAIVNPSLIAVARHEPPPISRVWDERTKGASKDTDWSVNLLWLLAFSRRPLRMQVGAFDAEQASEVRLIIRDVLRQDAPVNTFLREVIDVQADQIVNAHTGGIIEIMTSDKWGSHGSRIDVLLLNELTHQPSDGFAETLMDNCDKMPNSLVVIATNSGHDPSWQLQWKRLFQTSDRWRVMEYSRPSPWVSDAALAESAKRNPAGRFERLWHGVWSAEESDPAIDPADLAAAFVPGLLPLDRAERDFDYVAGLDLAIVRHAAALVVLGIDRSRTGFGRIRLAAVKVWRAPSGRRIDLQAIEDACFAAHAAYSLQGLTIDFWQAAFMGQRLARGAGDFGLAKPRFDHFGLPPPARPAVPVIEFMPHSKNLQAVATAVREAFADRRVMLYENADLKADLKRLRLVERPNSSFRLMSPEVLAATREGTGAGTPHGDAATAFSLAMLAASERATSPIVWVGGDGNEPFEEPRALSDAGRRIDESFIRAASEGRVYGLDGNNPFQRR